MNVLDTISSFQSEAPVNVEALAEVFGIKLERKAKLHDSIAGEIQRLPDGRFKISINENDHYFRRRFTMAHELGHFLLHRDLIGDGVDDNRAYRSTDDGNFYNTKITQAHETEANRFAVNLLMPAALVRRCFHECEGNLARLSAALQVSKEALRYRLQALKLPVNEPA